MRYFHFKETFLTEPCQKINRNDTIFIPYIHFLNKSRDQTLRERRQGSHKLPIRLISPEGPASILLSISPSHSSVYFDPLIRQCKFCMLHEAEADQQGVSKRFEPKEQGGER